MRITLHKLILVAMLAFGLPCAWSGSAAQTPGSIAVNPSGIVYYAQAGDTLISIAHRFTAKASNWAALGDINRISQDTSIPIGAGIVIPADLLTDEPGEATVIARNGAITATYPDGSSSLLNVGSRIVEGMKIQTGINSFLTISLPDASRISLPSNSGMQMTKLRRALYTGSPRVEVTLLRGRVLSRVSPLDTNKGRFEVRTPLSVAGVRGTYFRANYDGNRASTEVLDGHVATSSSRTQETRLLPPAKGNIINSSNVGPAIDLLPPPQLSDMPYRQAGVAQFTLKPVGGARGYHVELAQDAEMLNLLAEATANTTSIPLDNIAEGHYFARLSAIDVLGLEGLPRVVAVSIRNRSAAAINEPPQPAPAVASSDPGELILRWQGMADTRYNIQVARDAEFSWLIYSTTVTGTEARFPRPAFGTYYARVQRINEDGSTRTFSYPQSMIVTDQWIINDGHPLRPGQSTHNASR
ncbi:MAG TPA: FecR domain-containing protein [Oxalicibacterium sp.]|nr:FecR domain-containing protein [Oxalicibacterium sp.]